MLYEYYRKDEVLFFSAKTVNGKCNREIRKFINIEKLVFQTLTRLKERKCSSEANRRVLNCYLILIFYMVVRDKPFFIDEATYNDRDVFY